MCRRQLLGLYFEFEYLQCVGIYFRYTVENSISQIHVAFRISAAILSFLVDLYFRFHVYFVGHVQEISQKHARYS